MPPAHRFRGIKASVWRDTNTLPRLARAAFGTCIQSALQRPVLFQDEVVEFESSDTVVIVTEQRDRCTN
ncbi:hypothetical protein EVAR_56114_1 [Eumeta japonica]|uniref:Uncharacterized protein n=1 Tax=Eumeta variegata TaxID=151549 RepID=A0A4C1YCX6_EUMVA|nr:hypothetical protein EVAR_56114_1 [Eumeta japonica]